MSNFSSRLPSRRTVVQTIAIVVIVLALSVTLLAGWVYNQAINRFEVRRVSLPTRIYTDMMPLRPGQLLTLGDLQEKLERLAYAPDPTLGKPGSFAKAKGGIDLHLRPFQHPSGEHTAEAVALRFKQGVLESVTSRNGGGPVETAALEPELLTSVLGDQLENRRPVAIDQVPQHLKDAVVVAEDVRFWHHPGVDPIGIVRAGIRNLRTKRVSEGGSTLTQQLVKNYYLTSEQTLKRKIVEAFMSVILDAKYSKKEILEAYLNDIYLGRNRSISILGVGEASRFYFGKPVGEISIAEAALLAGMIPSPNNISPFVNPQRARERRKIVLTALLRSRKITQEQHDMALEAPLPRQASRAKSTLSSIPFYVDRVISEMKTDYGIDDVKGRGLAIYTAIDLAAQDSATRALETGLQNLEKSYRKLRRPTNPLEGVIISVDVPSGEIRALIGGRNYERSQFNRALDSHRQVGSLFKPFVFLTAFEPSLSNQNITPSTLVNDQKFVLKRRFSKDWSPGNYEGVYHGVVTVRSALEQSMNAASVRVGLSAGIDAVIKTARTLGVDSELDAQPSIFLGAVGVPPVEMAEAYSTIARMGSRLPLRTVRFVMDDRGQVITSGGEPEAVQVFPARDVFLLVHVMEGVLSRGTGRAARSLGFRKTAAGKTGTTNDKRDAWFIGFTPQTLAVTWIGFDDNSPIGVSGSEGAVPIWTRYMKDVAGSGPDLEFRVPSGIVFTSICSVSGGLETIQCPPTAIVNEAFKAGTEPGTPCPTHSPQMLQVMLGPDGLPIDPTMVDPTVGWGTLPPLPPPLALPGVETPRPEPVPGVAPPATATTAPAPPPSSQPAVVPPASDQPREVPPTGTETPTTTP